MMTTRTVAIATALAAVALSGCSYPVFVLTQRGTGHPEGPPAPFTVFVRSTPESAEDADADEVALKIRKALEARGISTVANEADADFIVLFEYEVKALLARAQLRTISGASSGLRTERAEGPFDHSLSLWLVDGPAYRDEAREELIWLGGAAMGRVPTRGTRFLDVLVLETVDRFLVETRDTIEVRVRLDGSRAKALR